MPLSPRPPGTQWKKAAGGCPAASRCLPSGTCGSPGGRGGGCGPAHPFPPPPNSKADALFSVQGTRGGRDELHQAGRATPPPRAGGGVLESLPCPSSLGVLAPAPLSPPNAARGAGRASRPVASPGGLLRSHTTPTFVVPEQPEPDGMPDQCPHTSAKVN